MTKPRSGVFLPASRTKPVVLVGVCAAGKTTISRLLADYGIWAKPVAQEHSRVVDLYRRTGETVVMLVASWEAVHRRRSLSWDPAFYRTEWDRLREARRVARLLVHTDTLAPQDVAEIIVDWYDRAEGYEHLWRQSPEWTEALRRTVRLGQRPPQ